MSILVINPSVKNWMAQWPFTKVETVKITVISYGDQSVGLAPFTAVADTGLQQKDLENHREDIRQLFTDLYSNIWGETVELAIFEDETVDDAGHIIRKITT